MSRITEIVQSFQLREDDFSYQISSTKDPRFWFRLEKRSDKKEVITDYFLGNAEEAYGGLLLTECYRALNRRPGNVIIFKDILSSNTDVPDLASAALEARKKYAAYGREMLQTYGCQNARQRLNKSGKSTT